MINQDLFKEETQIIFVLGPTGSGKSDYGFDLAQQLSCDIISADAYQIYREMNIGTAKPLPKMRRSVRHHLIDCVSIHNSFDVSHFVKQAELCLLECLKRDKKVIIVGGTNYYIKTLLDGLYQTPPSDKEIVVRWKHWLNKYGSDSLWKEVDRVDRFSAQRIHCHDNYRLIRVLDVFEQTGRPLSSFKREGGLRNRFVYQKIGLSLSWSFFLRKINARIKTMIDNGFLAEVQSLLEKGAFQTNAFQTALGYKEAKDVLDHKLSLNDFSSLLFEKTKKLIKKQNKWLKKDKEILWINVEDENKIHNND